MILRGIFSIRNWLLASRFSWGLTKADPSLMLNRLLSSNPLLEPSKEDKTPPDEDTPNPILKSLVEKESPTSSLLLFEKRAGQIDYNSWPMNTQHLQLSGAPRRQFKGEPDFTVLPQVAYKHPFNGDPHVILLCESFDSKSGRPTQFNQRSRLLENLRKIAYQEPLFEFEQPNIIDTINGSPFEVSAKGDENSHYKWARNVLDAHMRVCETAGLHFSVENIDLLRGQWEYTVQGSNPVETADDFNMLQYFKSRIIAECLGLQLLVPVMNIGQFYFSTKAMRDPEEGKYALKDAYYRVFKNILGKYVEVPVETPKAKAKIWMEDGRGLGINTDLLAASWGLSPLNPHFLCDSLIRACLLDEAVHEEEP